MRLLKNIFRVIFCASTSLFVLMMIVLVLGQLISVCVLNGELTSSLESLLLKPAELLSGVTALSAFISGYLYHWKSED